MIPRDGAAVMGTLMVPSSGCWGPEANQRYPYFTGRARLCCGPRQAVQACGQSSWDSLQRDTDWGDFLVLPEQLQ